MWLPPLTIRERPSCMLLISKEVVDSLFLDVFQKRSYFWVSISGAGTRCDDLYGTQGAGAGRSAGKIDAFKTAG